jgi:hypothetical protein
MNSDITPTVDFSNTGQEFVFNKIKILKEFNKNLQSVLFGTQIPVHVSPPDCIYGCRWPKELA